MKTAFSLLAWLACSTIVFADKPPADWFREQPFSEFGWPRKGYESSEFVRLAADARLQHDLNADPRQRKKLKEIYETAIQDEAELFAPLRNEFKQPLPEQARKRAEEPNVRSMVWEAAKLRADVFLSESQSNRIRQIMFQRLMHRVFLGNDYLHYLNPTPQQQEALKRRWLEHVDRVRKKEMEGRESYRQFWSEIYGILTDEQRRKFEELRGPPLEETDDQQPSPAEQTSQKNNIGTVLGRSVHREELEFTEQENVRLTAHDVSATDDQERDDKSWGPAVEGLHARLRTGISTWRLGEGEVVTFLTDVRNTGKTPRTIPLTQTLCELEFDGDVYRWADPINYEASPLAAGRTVSDIPIVLFSIWKNEKGKLLNLSVGKHRVRVIFLAERERKPGQSAAPTRVPSNVVEFEVAGKQTESAPREKGLDESWIVRRLIPARFWADRPTIRKSEAPVRIEVANKAVQGNKIALSLAITNKSQSPIQVRLPHEWHGGIWPTTDLYASVTPINLKHRVAFHEVFLLGEDQSSKSLPAIESGETIDITVRMDWPGTGSRGTQPLMNARLAKTYNVRFLLAFTRDGKAEYVAGPETRVELAPAKPKKEEETKEGASPKTGAAPTTTSQVDGPWGSVTGRVVWKGPVSGTWGVEGLAVNPQNQGIRDAFVFVESKPEQIHRDYLGNKPAPAKMVYSNRDFRPRSLVLQVGQPIEVSSDDPRRAGNVWPRNLKNNQEFNVTVAKKPFVWTPKDPEPSPVRIVNMADPLARSNWLIVDHPYATVTGRDGSFRLEKLPAGEHTLAIWHEAAGYLVSGLKVKVNAGQVVEVPDQTLTVQQIPRIRLKAPLPTWSEIETVNNMQARLTIDDYGRDTVNGVKSAFAVIEIRNSNGPYAVDFRLSDKKQTELQILDADGEPVEKVKLHFRTLPRFPDHGSLPPHCYLGLRTFSSGVDFSRSLNHATFVAWRDAWHLNPGTYTLQGTLEISVREDIRNKETPWKDVSLKLAPIEFVVPQPAE